LLGRARLAQAEAALCDDVRSAGIEHGLAAMGLLPPWSMTWCRAAMHVLMGALALGDMDRMKVILRELEGQRDVPPAMAPQFILLAVVMVTGFTYTGSVGEVLPLVKRLPAILEVAEEEAHRSPEIAGHVHFARGFHALLEGGMTAAAESFNAAVEPLTRAGDQRFAAVARTNAALGYVQLGAFEEAKKKLQDAHAFLKDAGMFHFAMRMKIMGGVVLAYEGNLEGARACVEEVEGALNDDGERDFLAYIHLLLGDLDAAEREARAAHAHSSVKMPTFVWFSSAVLAKVALQRGRAHEALAWAREASRVLTNPDGLSELGYELVRLVLAEALDACGEREEAAKVIALARARLMKLASKIADPARRRAFLERLPENARTLELAARWLGEAPPAGSRRDEP
jgi:ATP/maltotriose-dependent transcriptional regulator MalT